MEVVNLNGGAAVEKASACKSGGIARPGGMISGAQVGGRHKQASLHHVGVAVAVIAPCVVPWSLSLCHI